MLSYTGFGPGPTLQCAEYGHNRPIPVICPAFPDTADIGSVPWIGRATPTHALSGLPGFSSFSKVGMSSETVGWMGTAHCKAE